MAGDSPREILCQCAQAAGLRLDDGRLLAMIMAGRSCAPGQACGRVTSVRRAEVFRGTGRMACAFDKCCPGAFPPGPRAVACSGPGGHWPRARCRSPWTPAEQILLR
jgi:hypothetical protein